MSTDTKDTKETKPILVNPKRSTFQFYCELFDHANPAWHRKYPSYTQWLRYLIDESLKCPGSDNQPGEKDRSLLSERAPLEKSQLPSGSNGWNAK